jgi:hypothetical protein
MSPNNKLHLFVATSTVGTMYKLLRELGTLFPQGSLEKAWYGSPFLWLGTIAFYQLLASILLWSFGYFRLFRRLILGPEYVEGTWIGSYMDPEGQRFTVEHFEQRIDGVTIRGYAFDEKSEIRTTWTSDAVAVDADKGKITFSYDCRPGTKITSHEGLARFTFHRAGTRSPPTELIGYSADLIDGNRSFNRETNISRKLLPPAEAFERARKAFQAPITGKN